MRVTLARELRNAFGMPLGGFAGLVGFPRFVIDGVLSLANSSRAMLR
jgi:hypothetical protein